MWAWLRELTIWLTSNSADYGRASQIFMQTRDIYSHTHFHFHFDSSQLKRQNLPLGHKQTEKENKRHSIFKCYRYALDLLSKFDIWKEELIINMVVHSYNLNTWEVEDQEFKVRCIESLRPAWATWGPFSTNRNKNKKEGIDIRPFYRNMNSGYLATDKKLELLWFLQYYLRYQFLKLLHIQVRHWCYSDFNCVWWCWTLKPRHCSWKQV